MLRAGGKVVSNVVEFRANVSFGCMCLDMADGRSWEFGPDVYQPPVQGASRVGFEGVQGGGG